MMPTATWTEVKAKKLAAMTPDEREEYERGYAEAELAAEVGERVRVARERAGLTQRELASRMGTSQAAVARLEAGAAGATLTTLHRIASAVGSSGSSFVRPLDRRTDP